MSNVTKSRLLVLMVTLAPLLGSPTKSSAAGPQIPGFTGLGIIGGEAVPANTTVGRSTVRLSIAAGDKSYLCSGTIIAPDIVMTAAHCLVKADRVLVYTQDGPRLSVAFKSHEEYRSRTLTAGFLGFGVRTDGTRNDIGLIRLHQDVPLNLVARLPFRALQAGEGIDVVIAGFGRTSLDENIDSSGVLTMAPARAELKILTTELTEAQLGITGRQLCNGDSGGPIYAVLDGIYSVIGVESYGVDGCVGEDRAVSVAHKLGWLMQTIKTLRDTPAAAQGE